jgi:hypothetical protein
MWEQVEGIQLNVIKKEEVIAAEIVINLCMRGGECCVIFSAVVERLIMN